MTILYHKSERRTMNKKLALALAVGTFGVAFTQSNGDYTLVGILTFLAGAMGAITSYVFTLIRIVFPVIDEEVAQYSSLGIAVLIGVAAKALLPYAPTAPAWINEYLPFLVYLGQQAWYLLNKETPKYVEARELGVAYSMNH